MNDQAMFKASVHGLRTVPSRKVIQVIVECPIEQLPHVASVCEHGAWLAIARLCNEQGEQDKPKAQSRDWDDMTPAEQAGVLCNDPPFWKYLEERQNRPVTSENEASHLVRVICMVNSRKEIIHGTMSWMRWNALVQRYRTWQIAPRIVA